MESQEIPNEALKQHIQRLVETIDIETTGLKSFIRLLSKEIGEDISHRKAFIKTELTAALTERLSQDGKDEEEEEDEDDEIDEEEEQWGEMKQRTKRKKAINKDGGSKGDKGLKQKKEISPQLAEFIGQGNRMARTDIVKAMWAYIKEHELQDPAKKSDIVLDDRMKEVFGCDRFTMFSMNKYISVHIHPFKPLDLSSKPKENTPKKRKAAGDKKRRSGGTQPPWRLSEELATVVDASELPRPQVVSKIWEYIKANDLQNPNDKREIICDDKLRAIMKKDKVTMFNMNKLITPHFLEKIENDGNKKARVENDDDDDEEED